jgi:hypothetical protein
MFPSSSSAQVEKSNGISLPATIWLAEAARTGLAPITLAWFWSEVTKNELQVSDHEFFNERWNVESAEAQKLLPSKAAI